MVEKRCRNATVGLNLYNNGDEYQKQDIYNGSLKPGFFFLLILIYTPKKTTYMYMEEIKSYKNVAEMLV